MKYFLSIFTTFLIAFVPMAQALTPPLPFSDVDAMNPYFTDINFLKTKGISQGDEAGLFSPERALSRCELLKVSLIAKAVTVPEVTVSAFPDLQTSFWCNKYAAYAKAQSIINGYPDGTFKGNNFVTEIEAMKILLNSLGVTLPTPTVDLYTNAKVGEWWTPYLQYIKDKKVEFMVDTPKYPLQDNFLRKKMARVLYRVMTMKELNMTEWSDRLPQPPVTGPVEYSDPKFKVTYDSSKWTKLDGGDATFQLAQGSTVTISHPQLDNCTDLATCFSSWSTMARIAILGTPVLGVGTFKDYQTVVSTSKTVDETTTYKSFLFFQNNTFFDVTYIAPTTGFDAFVTEAQVLLDTFALHLPI